MQLILLGTETPFVFRWWSGHHETYEACYQYRIDDPTDGCQGGEIYLALGRRKAFGADRRRVIVFRNRTKVLAEFVGVDDWEHSRSVVYSLKHPQSHRHIRLEADVPPGFAGCKVAPFDLWISGRHARTGLAIRTIESDHQAMVRVALIRESHREQDELSECFPGKLNRAESSDCRVRDMRETLIVISCGSQKVWDHDPARGPVAARNAYTGPFFTTNRRYAERFGGDDWMILSSRFGFLKPDTPITNYSSRFGHAETLPLATDQLRVSAIQGGVTAYRRIQVLGGAAYVKAVRQALAGFPVQVASPFAHCTGIGDMMGMSHRALGSGVPLDPEEVAVNPAPRHQQPQSEQHTSPLPRGQRSRSRTSDPVFIQRVFELSETQGLTQSAAVRQAAAELGLNLSSSFLKYPGVRIRYWRKKGLWPGSSSPNV